MLALGTYALMSQHIVNVKAQLLPEDRGLQRESFCTGEGYSAEHVVF